MFIFNYYIFFIVYIHSYKNKKNSDTEYVGTLSIILSSAKIVF